MRPTEPFDVAALTISLVALAGYHVVYTVETYWGQNSMFNLSINSKVTDLWVDKYFNHRNPEAMIEAIYTMRNTVLIAIFLGGYTLETSYGLMTPSASVPPYVPTPHATASVDTTDSLTVPLNTYSGQSTLPNNAGTWVLIICLFSSFLCWLQVLFNTVRLGYVIDGWDGPVIPFGHAVSASASTEPLPVVARQVCPTCPTTFSLAARKEKYCRYAKFLARNVVVYFSFAFRFLYISVPFAFYNLGSIALLVSTAIMLAIEIIWDYQLF